MKKRKNKEEDSEYYEIDWCYECGGLGDDYSIVDGELVSNCDSCPYNPNRTDLDE